MNPLSPIPSPFALRHIITLRMYHLNGELEMLDSSVDGQGLAASVFESLKAILEPQIPHLKGFRLHWMQGGFAETLDPALSVIQRGEIKGGTDHNDNPL